MFDAEAMVRQLTEQRVEFIVIGGLAMIGNAAAPFVAPSAQLALDALRAFDIKSRLTPM